MTKPYLLSRDEESFAEDLVESGRYGSVDDVVREALRTLREREGSGIRTLDELRQAWREGVESGEPIDAEEVFADLRARYDDRARTGER